MKNNIIAQLFSRYQPTACGEANMLNMNDVDKISLRPTNTKESMFEGKAF